MAKKATKKTTKKNSALFVNNQKNLGEPIDGQVVGVFQSWVGIRFSKKIVNIYRAWLPEDVNVGDIITLKMGKVGTREYWDCEAKEIKITEALYVEGIEVVKVRKGSKAIKITKEVTDY